MSNNEKAVMGKSNRSLRYHPVTVKWALKLMIKHGQTTYEEIADVLSLPSARYLRDFKNAFKVSTSATGPAASPCHVRLLPPAHARLVRDGPFACGSGSAPVTQTARQQLQILPT